MSKSKELVKNTAIISFGKMCTQLVSFVLMPLYTKVLSTEEYGIVDLIITYGQLLLPIFSLQMEQALFRFLVESRDDEQKKKNVISDILILTLFVALILTAVMGIVFAFIKNDYSISFLGNLWAGLLITMLLQMARGVGNNKLYALGSFLAAAGNVLLNIVFVLWLKMGAGGMILAMIIAQIATSAFMAYKLELIRYLKLKVPDMGELRKYVRYSTPLIPNAISWWILNASDRSIILKFLGVAFNGIYSAANKFSGIYTTLFNIFNLSWTESVVLYINGEGAQEEYSRIQSRVVGICISIAAGIICVMPFAFDILVNEKFADAYYQIPILVVGAFFSSMVGLGSGFYVAAKETATIARTTILGAICNICINIALITRIGLYAASISTVLAYFILFVIRSIDIKKKFGVSFDYLLLSSGVALMLLGYATYFVNNIIVYLVMFLLYIIYALVVNRALISSSYNILIHKLKK